MSFQEQASRWMRRCHIPVLTYAVGEAVLERPIGNLSISACQADNIFEVEVQYERVHASLTGILDDFRYVSLPAEAHIHTGEFRLYQKFPIPTKD